MRLEIPAGTAVRFEPGQTRDVNLVALAGTRTVYGFRQEIMGKLEKGKYKPTGERLRAGAGHPGAMRKRRSRKAAPTQCVKYFCDRRGRFSGGFFRTPLLASFAEGGRHPILLAALLRCTHSAGGQ